MGSDFYNLNYIVMNNLSEAFDKIVNRRRSSRMYDQNYDFDHGIVQKSLERAVLAPNSLNLQLWEFYRVVSEDKKQELAEICLGQKSAATANELVVFVTRGDLWNKRRKQNLTVLEKRFEGRELTKGEKNTLDEYKKLVPFIYFNDIFRITAAIKKFFGFIGGLFQPVPRTVGNSDLRADVHKNIALAAQTFILSVTAEGYDTCAMNGFDGPKVKKFLKLPFGAEVSMVVSVGKAKKEGIYGARYRVPNEEVIFKV